jgi:hypothetical protein
MSLGGGIGAIAGGVLGFFVGGPYGAYLGAQLGFAVGMMIDPQTPDVRTPGTPKQDPQITPNKMGDPVPDALGTVKITGHLLPYGKERARAIEQSPPGGKGGGGGGSMVTGHVYFMSWGIGICMGPVDTLYTILRDEKILWEGVLNRPESGGVEILEIKKFGEIYFYFGTEDQAPNDTMGEIIGDATLNTPYRGFCWAFFYDCKLGQINRMPVMTFVVKKCPDISAFPEVRQIDTYDYNPAHVIWYVLSRMVGLSESWLNAANFEAVGYTLYDEGRGISVLFDQYQEALSYLESVNAHIEGLIRFNTDGTFHMKLIREDYDVADLETLSESSLVDEPQFSRRAWIDTINEIKIQYSKISEVTRYGASSPYIFILRGSSASRGVVRLNRASLAWVDAMYFESDETPMHVGRSGVKRFNDKRLVYRDPDGCSYVGAGGNQPGAPTKLVKFNLNTFERIGAVTVGSTYPVAECIVDSDGTFLYLLRNIFGVSDTIFKIRRDTMTLEDSVVMPGDSGYYNGINSIEIDEDNGYLYVGTNRGAPWWYTGIVRFSLGSFLFADVVAPIEAGGDVVALHKVGAHLLMLSRLSTLDYGGQSRLTKLNLPSCTVAASLTFNADEVNAHYMIIDSAREFAYIGLRTNLLTILKINIATMARVARVELADTSQDSCGGLALDEQKGFIYVTKEAGTGKLWRLTIDPFAYQDQMEAPYGESLDPEILITD